MTFVGANREVARLAGVRVNRIRFGGFVFAGLLSGLAGVLLAANIGGYEPSSSAESLLPPGRDLPRHRIVLPGASMVARGSRSSS